MQQKEKVSEVVCPSCSRIGSMVTVNQEVLRCSVCFTHVDADPEIRARTKRIQEESAHKRALLREAQEQSTRQNRFNRTRRV